MGQQLLTATVKVWSIG